MKINIYKYFLVFFLVLLNGYYLYNNINWIAIIYSNLIILISIYLFFYHEGDWYEKIFILITFIVGTSLFFDIYINDWSSSLIKLIILIILAYYKIENVLFNFAHLFYNHANNISLAFCNLAIKLGVNQSNIYKLKGDILLEKDDYEGAFECYKHVLYLENSEESINDIAVSLEYLGKYDDALYYYDNALNINPNNSLTLNNKAILLIKLKKYDEALSILNEVLEIDENNTCAIENKEKILNELNK